MAEVVCVRGKVKKGDPCWRLTSPEGDQWFLVGDLSDVRDGDDVFACGVEADRSFCGEGRTLAVSWVSKKYGGGAQLPSSGVRDVTVSVTLSTRDYEPTFKLEEEKLNLTAAGAVWRGGFSGVPVTGPLDVFFTSQGWPDQIFTMTVEAKDPADASKVWKKEYKGVVKKKHVLIDEDMDVGLGAAATVVAATAGGGE